jgi:nicotinamidase-related amidase
VIRPFLALLFGAASLPAIAAPEPIGVTQRRITTVFQTRTVERDGKLFTEKVPVTTAHDTKRELDPTKTAIVICDMWDDHWCKSAAERCDALAKRAAPVVIAARRAGMTIVHCPSDTMDFYKDSPARQRAKDVKKVDPPKMKVIDAPALPIDDSDGGCDDAEAPKFRKAWTRQHKAIEVDEERDFVSDSGPEVYSILQSKGIKAVIVMGVHTNMCVLNRGFAIKQLTKWGVDCLLVRDLTDAMYNPKAKPFVKHEVGTLMVIQHIEQYWCPTIESKDLLGKK